MVRDPVCGMEVDPEGTGWVAEHDGKEYYFCSERCQRTFMENPERYGAGRRGYGHSGHGVHVGGCCGMGMGRGWISYVHVAILVFLLLLLFFR